MCLIFNIRMKTDREDIKFKALEASVYCPPFKEENAIETIVLEGEFDVEKAKDEVRRSVSLLSYQRSYRPEIIEILDVLAQNTAHFLVDRQTCITFYWSGILVCRIDIKGVMNDNNHGKQLHVSLQKYKVEKERLEKEIRNNNLMMLGFGGSLAVGAVVACYAFIKKMRDN